MDHAISKQIEIIREQLSSLNRLRGVIDDETIVKKESELKARLETLFSPELSQVPDSSDERTVISALGDHSVLIGGNATSLNIITGNGNRIVVSPEKISQETLFIAYLRSIATECSNLPLGIVDPKFAQPIQENKITLTDVYTDLDVTSPPARGDDTRRVWSQKLSRDPGDQRFPVIKALVNPEMKSFVLLGDAGSGKTTFINYFTYKIIQSLLNPLTEPLNLALKDKVVIRLILRNVASKIPIDSLRGSAQILWDAINLDMVNRLGELAAIRLFPYLQERFWERGGILLLDGLDEVPQSGHRRKCLIEAIQDLASGFHESSRIIVTARPYAYADPEWHLPNFQVLALAPFNKEQISRFIEHWHNAVSQIMGWSSSTSQDRAEKLISTVQERPYLFDLATRPLLLTLMTTLHTSWGQLPEDRADLYEEATKLLLSRWERGRETKGADGKQLIEPSVARVLGIGENLLRTLLERLAYQTHQKQAEQAQKDDAPADISVGDILAAFSDTLPDDINPRILLEYLEARSGLLISRREGIFTFPHRSFQEYFSACYLTNQPDFVLKIRELAWLDIEWWREVCLLAIGKARQGGLFNAVSMLNILLPESVEEIIHIDDKHWSLAVLVGQAVVELRLVERSRGQPYYRAIQNRTIEWLVSAIERGKLLARERHIAGDSLGQIGDPRKGIGADKIMDTDSLFPDISWVEIPEGKFTMGNTHTDDNNLDLEYPSHDVYLQKFFMSRYPVTNAQYRPFVEDGGYENSSYWTEVGWNWRNGIDPGFSGKEVDYEDDDRENQYANWLRVRIADRRRQPFWWNDPQWGIANRPVVGVNWYEAMAYAKWVSVKMKDAKLDILSSGNYIVRLPTEAEWEKAAKGPLNYKWAWGNEWEADCANTLEMELRQTSAVGIFPKGNSYYGLGDMTGNVFEFVSTGLGRTGQHHSETPRFLYPYSAVDGREGIEAIDVRICRGGAWYFDKKEALCVTREWDYPIVFDQNTGFRIALGNPIYSR